MMFIKFMVRQKKVGFEITHAVWLQSCKRKIGKILESNTPEY